MGKLSTTVLAVFAIAFIVTGCEKKQAQVQPTTESVAQSIDAAATQVQEAAQTITEQAQAVQEQAAATDTQTLTNTLIAQAQQFMIEKKYQEAISAAQEVLAKYDPNSTIAQNIITQAQEAISQMASEAKDNVQAQATTAVDNVKGALGSYGK